MSSEQIDLLLNCGIRKLCVLFDGDDPGRDGSAKAAADLAKLFYVKAPTVPDGFKPRNCDESLLRQLMQ